MALVFPYIAIDTLWFHSTDKDSPNLFAECNPCHACVETMVDLQVITLCRIIIFFHHFGGMCCRHYQCDWFKLETAHSSEPLEQTHRPTQCSNAEYLHWNNTHHKSLKTYKWWMCPSLAKFDVIKAEEITWFFHTGTSQGSEQIGVNKFIGII